MNINLLEKLTKLRTSFKNLNIDTIKNLNSDTIGKLTFFGISLGSLSLTSYLIYNDKNKKPLYLSPIKKTYGNLHENNNPEKIEYNKNSPAICNESILTNCLIISNLDDMIYSDQPYINFNFLHNKVNYDKYLNLFE